MNDDTPRYELAETERAMLARAYELAETERVRVRATSGGRIKRNSPCPCGSGRKYKKCCLARVNAGQLPRLTVDGLAKSLPPARYQSPKQVRRRARRELEKGN